MVSGHLSILQQRIMPFSFWLALFPVPLLLICLPVGARAAQVVPHVHFHIIPRPESRPEIKSRSWTMFGRGQRDELDDDEGTRLAGEMRRVLRDELERVKGGVVKL